MATTEKKGVCLLLNLGGFEMRMSENLALAEGLGNCIYSLTGNGLVRVESGAFIVPANVLAFTPAELLIWSSTINEQLQAEGFKADDAVILAAGKKFRGTLPLGTNIGQGIRLGA